MFRAVGEVLGGLVGTFRGSLETLGGRENVSKFKRIVSNFGGGVGEAGANVVNLARNVSRFFGNVVRWEIVSTFKRIVSNFQGSVGRSGTNVGNLASYVGRFGRYVETGKSISKMRSHVSTLWGSVARFVRSVMEL